MSRTTILVTRPAGQGSAWIEALRARGIDARAFPLIEIAPLDDPGDLQSLWSRWSRFQAVMFVSAEAVRHAFAAAQPRPGWHPAAPRVWCTGPGTAAALVEQGVPSAFIDAPAAGAAQFDSEALWTRVGPSVVAGACVAIVRGGDAAGQVSGRDWLANRLRQSGVQVEEYVAYRRLAPALDAERTALARAAIRQGTRWLFSSSESIGHLRHLLVGEDFAPGRALVTHPRIAEAARAAGFGGVRIVGPALDAVIASIESSA